MPLRHRLSDSKLLLALLALVAAHSAVFSVLNRSGDRPGLWQAIFFLSEVFIFGVIGGLYLWLTRKGRWLEKRARVVAMWMGLWAIGGGALSGALIA
jgi:hypothetical protein